MKNRLIRIFSAILTLAVLLALLPVQAFAAPGAPPYEYKLYVADLDKFIYSDVTDSPLDRVLCDILGDNMNPNNLPKAKKPSTDELIGMLRLADYRTGRKNNGVYEIRPYELKINGRPYALNDKQNELLIDVFYLTKKNITDANNKNYWGSGKNYPLWMLSFSWDQVTKLECSVNSKGDEFSPGSRYVATNKNLKADPYAWGFLKEMFIYNSVAPDSFAQYSGTIKDSLENYVEGKMALKNGTVYTLYFDNNGRLYIESSKNDYGCFYALNNSSMYEKFLVAIAAGEIPAE